MGRTRAGPTAPALQTLHHPDQCVQLSCKRRVGVSDGARVADALKKAQAKARRIDFEDAFAERNKAIANIAKLYNRKESYVRSVLCNISQYKRVHKPTLRNAVIHQRWRDLQGEGETKTLKELREDLQDEIDAGTFSLSSIETKERDRLINQLLEHRKLKRVGLRATTKAAQLDGRRTSGRIGDAVMHILTMHSSWTFSSARKSAADIVMSRPALWNVETARRVRNGFHSGAMHWVVMTQEQRAELVASHNAQREALGGGSLKKRAMRSDKGVPRKKTEGGDAVEEAGPTASSEDDALVPATLIPGVGTTTVDPPPLENPFPNVEYPQLIVMPENEGPVMDMNPYAPPLDPTDPAHELLTMDEIVNMQLGMEDLMWLAKNAAGSDTPLTAAVSDALTAPITSGFTAVPPAMFSDADAHGTPPRSITATASSTGSVLSTSAPLAAPSNATAPAAPSKTTAPAAPTASASPSNATAPAPPSHVAASMPQPRGRKRKTAAAPGDENAPPKKARKERSDKGVPKMKADGTFKSQKRREAAEATV
ncbi:hypothetical protein K438DRAFT_1789341 [Mycena galopus ATCC 62051]|nr:hypothetical protein K438DRAFT_1789341 [Mycena galopus ATCC 62051]